MVARIDTLTTEPVVGRYYMVPCVRVTHDRSVSGFPSGLWPVIGPLHDDVESLGFHPRHWHLDGRFLSASQMDNVTIKGSNSYRVFRVVLCKTGLYGQEGVPIPGVEDKTQLVRRRCMRAQPEYPDARVSGFAKLQESMAGSRVRCGRCPHRNLPLSSLPRVPGTNHVICVGHGLRFDMTTGSLVRQTGKKAPGLPEAITEVRLEKETE